MASVKFENCDLEDLGYTLAKVEKSFGLRIEDQAFKNVKTFGDICNVFTNHIELIHTNDCTSQQAFYKIRDAIIESQETIARADILPQTSLHVLFPKSNRINLVKRFETSLGFPVDFLGIERIAAFFIAITYVISVLSFFVHWHYGVIGFILSIIISRVCYLFRKRLRVDSVGQLANWLSTEFYIQSRRQQGTYNKKEIKGTIRQIFIDDLFIDSATLSDDSLMPKSKSM